jgi:hypothetical protein
MGAQQAGRGPAVAGRDPEQWDEPQPAHGGGFRREPDEPGGYGQQMSGGEYRQYRQLGNPYRGGQAPYGGGGQGPYGGGGQQPSGGYDEGGRSPYGGGEPRHLR